MTDQIELTEFEATARDQLSSNHSSGPTLFRLSTDPFVNAGVAELTRQVDDDLVDVERSQVTIADSTQIDRVTEQLKSIINDSLSATHRRKVIAHEINRTLDDLGAPPGDERRVQRSRQAFPGSHGDEQTIYDGDTVDASMLEAHGIPSEKIDRIDSEKTTLYAQSPRYVGNTSTLHFPSQVDRYEQYMETFVQALQGSFEASDKPCMSCGSIELPAYKGVDKTDLEYNQTFTPLAATGGRAKSLGTGGRSTAHRGRCVACLVAGFYYSFMPKIVRQTGTDDNDTRVFTPRGDLVELENVQDDLARALADIDEPTEGGRVRQRTLGSVGTQSLGLQALDLYETIYREVNRKYGDELFTQEIQYRPTTLITYVSKVDRTRELSSFETIDPNEWAYEAVAQRHFSRTEGPAEPFWPVQQVLWWFGAVDTAGTHPLEPRQDDIGLGILSRDLARIERGVTGVARGISALADDEGYVPSFPHPGYTHHYFSTIMNASTTSIDSIDDESINAIRDVATSVGRVFHGNEDIGVLINLQNASTSTEFLRAFEKASMQAQKKSLDDAPAPWDASKDEAVGTVLKLVSEKKTFEPAKRMFVIHAALAAQYANVSTDSTSVDETAETGTGGEGA